MASLYQRNGWFYLSFFHADRRPTQKQVALRTKDRKTAAKKQRELEGAFERGDYDPWTGTAPKPKADLRTLGDAASAFLTSRSNLTAKSLRWYRGILDLFVPFLGANFPTVSIAPQHVRGFLDSREMRTTSRHAYRRGLSAFFGWLQSEKAIRENPAADVRLERLPLKHPRFMTPEDVETLCGVIASASALAPRLDAGLWLVPVIRCNVYLGLRAGELVNLRWKDVDLDSRRLFVRNTDGFTTKAGRERTVPLCDAVCGLLRSVQRRSEYVFTNYSGGKLDREHLSRRFKHYARLAKLSEEICFHSTRHTAASWLAQQGASVEAIRLYMGHSSIHVTMRYTHLSPDGFAAQISAAFSRVCIGKPGTTLD